MQGRKDQKHANETGNTVSDELDEVALTRKLRRFVEHSDLSLPKIASEMGVFSATLAENTSKYKHRKYPSDKRHDH